MGLLEPNRRGFFGGLIAALAAPAIVKAQNIMPVRTPLIVRKPVIVPAYPRWMVTEIAHSFHADQLPVARVSLVEAFGADDTIARAVNRNSCHEGEWRDSVDVRQLEDLGGNRIMTARGQVHREASFSCDHDVANGLMPGDIVTFSHWPEAQEPNP